MAIRTERSPMGMGGNAWYLSTPRDLERLPPRAAALVPARLRALFSERPAAIAELARRAPLAPMRAWLEAAAPARCTLEIYATKHYRSGARLRFNLAEDWSPSIAGVAMEPRRRCPKLLREVHAVTGDIDYQFGCSGTLVPLDELRTVRELVEERRVLWAESVGELFSARPALASYVAWYETDGDWLCAGARGRTAWVGGEWVEAPMRVEQDLETMLCRYFEAMLARRHFHA